MMKELFRIIRVWNNLGFLDDQDIRRIYLMNDILSSSQIENEKIDNILIRKIFS